MNKFALAALAAALAAVSGPASAMQHGHQGHGHGYRQVQVRHVHGHHGHHRPIYHAPRYVKHYTPPTYVKPVVVYTKPTHECFWAVQKHGYETRKIWVCKLVEHKKPEKKVVEVVPTPTPQQAPEDAEQQK